MPSRDKQQVARQFSRAATSYDRAAGIQQRVVTSLLEQLKQNSLDTPSELTGMLAGHWLDIGCGTGVALPHLRHMGASTVTGVDLAEGMLSVARAHSDDQTQLILADADHLPMDNHCADGLISSLMLQWSEAPVTTLTEWHRVLKPRSPVAVATLLPGTQSELLQAWQQIDDRQHINDFISREDIIEAFTQAGFVVEHAQSERLTEHYASVTQLLRGLKDIGATNVNAGRRAGLGGRQALKELEEVYPTEEDNGNIHFPLSYEVLWIYARTV